MLEELGASTHVVLDRETGQRRMLRVLRLEDGARLRRELERIRLAAHPVLAQIHELGELEDGRSYYVQELVEGEDLFQWGIGRDPSEVVAVWAQLLEALACFQAHGFLPRGERRMSLRVEERDGQARLRLIDPGGVIDEGSREPRSGHGLAPERQVGARIDRRASLYEAGLVLYGLLAGSDVMALPSLELESGRAQSATALAPGLPLDLATLVMVLLRPFPDERPATVAAAIEALERVAGQRLTAPVPPPRLPAPTVLVGRTAELSRLRALAEPLLRPAGAGAAPSRDDAVGLALVQGPPGSGRRRLVDELAIRLGLEDVLVLRGVCGEGGQGPYGPLAALLRELLSTPQRRRLLEGLPAEQTWALRALLPDQVALLPAGPAPAPLQDPEGAAQRLHDALSAALLAVARARPMAVLLDDLDRARPETLALLGQLAREVALAGRDEPGFEGARGGARPGDAPAPEGEAPPPAPRLLVVGTCERAPELDSLLGVTTVALAPLDLEASRELARSALALPVEAPLPGGLREAVEARADGSPDQVLRLVRAHLEREAERDPDAPAQLAPTPAADPALDARLEGRLLRALACLDRAADVNLLAQAARTSPGQAEAALVALAARDEVERCGDTYRLAHRVETSERDPELAGRLARYLGARLSEPRRAPREQVLEVAELAATGREADLVARHAPLAAAWLEELEACERAAALALALAKADVDPLGWRRRAAELLLRAGEAERSEQLLRALIDEPGAREARETAALYRALTEGLLAREQEREARTALSWAHTYLEAEPELVLERAQVCAQAARLHLEAEEAAEAKARAEAGLALLAELSDLPPEGHRARAQLLGLLGLAAALDEEPREARQLHKAALAIQEREGLGEDAALSLVRLGRMAFEERDDAAAEGHWANALEARERLQDRRGVAQVCSSLALIASRRSRLAEARELLAESLRLREVMGDLQGAAASLHNLGWVYRHAGALPEAVACYRRALRLRLELDDRWYAALAANNLAEVLTDLGRTAEARPYAVQALGAHREQGDRLGEAHSLSVLAELDRRRGELGAALQGVALVEQLRAEQGGEDLEGQLDTLKLRARVRLTLGMVDQARRDAEAALKLCEEQELLKPFEPGVRLLLGQAHARRRSGRGVARRELERARREAERLGDRYTTRSAAIELAALRLAGGHPRDARALLDSRPVPRPGRMRPLEGSQPPDRRGMLRARERLLRARIELSLPEGSVTTAARCAEQALEEARRGELADLIWRSLQVAAATAELRGAHERALGLTLEAQETVEQVLANVPEERREAFLAADPLRQAALRGDSPVQALEVQARAVSEEGDAPVPLKGSGGELLQAMVESVVPTIQPATRQGRAAVEPAPVEEEEARPALEFTALVRLNRLIVDEPNLAAVHEAIVREAVGLCGAERGFLAVFGETADAARVLATVGIEEVEQGQRFFRRCAYKAASTGQLVLSAEAAVRPELKQEAHVVGLGLRSVLAAPVSVPDGQRGALYLDAGFQVGLFGDREAELAAALADLCALAIGRGVLEGALHDRRGLPAPGPEQRRYLEVQAQVAHAQVTPGAAVFGQAGAQLVGRSPAARRAVEMLELAAGGRDPVLILGPPGVGKGVCARALHGARGLAGELVVVDLRELRADRIEAELFGYAAGAVAGASAAYAGLIARARGGTLLLEHLSAAPLELQARLRRALEDGWVRPLGGDEQVPIGEVCVVATCSEDTEGAAPGQRFDETLALLLGRVRVELPPLDRRPEDKGPLIDALLDAWAREGSQRPVLTPAARQALEARSYRHNARELNAVLSAAVVVAGKRAVQPDDLPEARAQALRPLRFALADFERRYIEDALLAHRSDLTAAAAALGVTRRSLKRKLEQLRIAP
ncbi:MAG: sigma 54-interacting transcriptional regulator [Planctomycetota bacterium]